MGGNLNLRKYSKSAPFRVTVLGVIVLLASSMSAAPVLAQPSTTLAGADRYETAAKIAEAGWTARSEYAVLSAGADANLVDALTAAPLATSKNAPILLTQGDQLNSWAEQELKRLQVSTVYITSGSGVITDSVINKLHQMGLQTISLGGKDRFETAVNIAKQLKPFHKIVIATAWSNADALSVAPIAASEGMPILLTDTNNIPDTVSGYLKTLNGQIDQTYVLGLEGAVSNSVANTLPSAQRIGGKDRYQTNLEIVKNFREDLKFQKYYLASGEDTHLVDALAGSALTAQTSSPIILTAQEMPQTTLDYIRRNLPLQVQALGGEGAIPKNQLDQVTSAEQISSDNIQLQNTHIQGSITITGNNAMLTHVQVDGTVFLDPGAQGSAHLDDVSAGAVVILSGAPNSIHLAQVKAQTLQIQSSSLVGVVAESGTSIDSTILQSGVDLENNASNLGRVILNPDSSSQSISLKGTFPEVNIHNPAQLKLNSDTLIKQLNVLAPLNLAMDSTAKVEAWSKNGNEVQLSGEGVENIPGQETLPPTPSTGATEGGSVPSSSTVNTMTDIISGMTLNFNSGSSAKSLPFSLEGTTATVDLRSSSISDNDSVMSISITANRQAQITLGTSVITLDKGSNTNVIKDYGVPDGGAPGVQVGKIKTFLGNTPVSQEGTLMDTATKATFPFTLTIIVQ